MLITGQSILIKLQPLACELQQAAGGLKYTNKVTFPIMANLPEGRDAKLKGLKMLRDECAAQHPGSLAAERSTDKRIVKVR